MIAKNTTSIIVVNRKLDDTVSSNAQARSVEISQSLHKHRKQAER